MKKSFCVIIGLGVTGLSCARYCLQYDIPFVINDSRHHPPCLEQLKKLSSHINMVLGEISLQLIMQASLLLVSPGISLQHPAIAMAITKGIPVVGDIELFVQKIKQPIVAITGSNAKSTVVTLVGEMAKAQGKKAILGGNLGVPVLDLLSQSSPDFYCLELSSFQLERTYSLSAKIATVLNICEDHMDRYDNMDEYILIKKRIYKDCQLAVINRHDKRLYPSLDVPCISFGLDQPEQGHFGIIKAHGVHYLAYGNQCLMPVDDIKMPGRHNMMNALSALAIGDSLSFDLPKMLSVLRKFPGLPHRCQFLQEYGGVHWYNDSKSTNVGATMAAVDSLSSLTTTRGKIILIAGGVGKGTDFSPLKSLLKKHARQLIVLGIAAKRMIRCFKDIIDIEHVNDLQTAIEVADLVAVRGDIVLLSPACASFDMFQNFEDRGNQFMTLVQKWLHGK